MCVRLLYQGQIQLIKNHYKSKKKIRKQHQKDCGGVCIC